MENKILANNQMEDSALENVSGGEYIDGFRFEGEVAPGACLVGERYYVISGMFDWFYGELVEIFGNTFVFRVTLRNGRPERANRQSVNADQIMLYRRMYL